MRAFRTTDDFQRGKGVGVQRTIILGAAILTLWLLLSGHYEPGILVLGVGSTALVVFIAARMKRAQTSADSSLTPTFLVWFLAYLPWLVKEIIVSNVILARVVLSPRLPISPTMIHLRGRQRTELARFVYANSITLTPGTVTVDVQGQDLTVHVLMRSAVDGHEEHTMVRKIARLEGS